MTTYPPFLFINLLLGLGAALFFGALILRFASRIVPIDEPGALPHKTHARPTPLAGGLTLILALAAGLLLDSSLLAAWWRILLPMLLIFIFGLWDDYRRLPPRVKLAGQLLAAGLLLALGISVRILKPGVLGLNVVSVKAINAAITVFWVVGITNAFNLIDSMDGLLVGVSGVATAFMLLVALSVQDMGLLHLLALLLGMLIGLYYYNTEPARFFLGDSGAQTLGFLLATVGIIFTPNGYPQASSWFVPILILALPIFDTTLVTFSRLRRKSGVAHAGRDHIYHRLVALGYNSRRAVVLLHIAALIVGSLSFLALQMPPFWANGLFAAVCLAGAALIVFLESQYVP